jgi:putative dimethyl sulfoxide reductase chaperone
MKREMDTTAEHRTNTYGFLSIIYMQEPTKEFIKSLRKSNIFNLLKESGLKIDEQITNDDSNDFLNELVLEYTRLFIGPGKHISPYESVYRDNGEALWSDTTVKVKHLIESLGLEYSSAWSGLPDHIGAELEFMQKLTCREKEAWLQNDKKIAVRCLEFEKKFVDEHLSQWVPAFCDKVKEETISAFYVKIAELTKQFVDFDSKLIDESLAVKTAQG